MTSSTTTNLTGWLFANNSTVAGYAANVPMSGRLTLTTGVPVTTSDVTGSSSVFFTPYNGNLVTIWNGTMWVPYVFSQIGRTLTGLTSGKNYDVYGYVNSGSFTLDYVAWTNDTDRAISIEWLHGIQTNASQITGVISGNVVSANQAILLGTIRTTSTTTTEDSVTKRFVSNALNPVPKLLARSDYVNSHTYSSTTIRGWNNGSGATLEWVSTFPSRAPMLSLVGAMLPSGAGTQGARLGLGTSTSTTPALVIDHSAAAAVGDGFALPLAPSTGYVIYYVSESATGTNNSTFYYYDVKGLVWV